MKLIIRFIMKIISWFMFPRIKAKNFRRYYEYGKGSLKIKGKNNRIYIVDDNGKKIEINWAIAGLNIEINGNDNIITIGFPYHFENSKILLFGDSNFFSCKPTSIGIKKASFYISRGSLIDIGRNFGSCENCNFFIGEEYNMKCFIGDEVLFSFNNIVRTSDAHTIYDIKTNKLINYGKNIHIGNHVWICEGCTLLKGSTIPNNCVIGCKSVVNSEFKDSNSIICGVPAKIVKKYINWSIESIPEFCKHQDNLINKIKLEEIKYDYNVP